MSGFTQWVCDQGDGTFDHDWKWASDSIGDSGVPNGTQTIRFRVCRVCGVEDHETSHQPHDFRTWHALRLADETLQGGDAPWRRKLNRPV